MYVVGNYLDSFARVPNDTPLLEIRGGFSNL